MEGIGTVSPAIPLGVHHFKPADAGRILQCVANRGIAHYHDLRFFAGGTYGLAIGFGDLRTFAGVAVTQQSMSSTQGGFLIDKYSPILTLPSLPIIL